MIFLFAGIHRYIHIHARAWKTETQILRYFSAIKPVSDVDTLVWPNTATKDNQHFHTDNKSRQDYQNCGLWALSALHNSGKHRGGGFLQHTKQIASKKLCISHLPEYPCLTLTTLKFVKTVAAFVGTCSFTCAEIFNGWRYSRSI